MAKRRPVFRVVVGTDPGPRSGLWRIWSHRDDIYLHCHDSRADAKTSLHASGRNRHAMSEDAARRWRPGQDRAFYKWDAPEDKILAEIGFPTDGLSEPAPYLSEEDKSKAVLLTPAPPGGMAVISVCLVTSRREPDREKAPVGGLLAPGVLLLADWPLESRGRVLILASAEPVPPHLEREVERVLPEIAEKAGQLAPTNNFADWRVLLYLESDPDGIARYVEVAGPRQEMESGLASTETTLPARRGSGVVMMPLRRPPSAWPDSS